MGDEGFRRLGALIAGGSDVPTLTAEIDQYPPEERVDLCRYAWGLLEPGHDAEREAALWLYAWVLEAQGQEQRGGVGTLDPYD